MVNTTYRHITLRFKVNPRVIDRILGRNYIISDTTTTCLDDLRLKLGTNQRKKPRLPY